MQRRFRCRFVVFASKSHAHASTIIDPTVRVGGTDDSALDPALALSEPASELPFDWTNAGLAVGIGIISRTFFRAPRRPFVVIVLNIDFD